MAYVGVKYFDFESSFAFVLCPSEELARTPVLVPSVYFIGCHRFSVLRNASALWAAVALTTLK